MLCKSDKPSIIIIIYDDECVWEGDDDINYGKRTKQGRRRGGLVRVGSGSGVTGTTGGSGQATSFFWGGIYPYKGIIN